MLTKRKWNIWLLALAVFIPRPAYAYLDPGTGSMIVQMIIAGVAGLGVVLKIYWHRFKNFLWRRNKSKEGDKK